MNLDNVDVANADLLLSAGEVPPVFEKNEDGASPFLLTADHYGRLIPHKLGDLGLPASERERHIAWDIGIDGVAERLSDMLGAHLIAQRYSRLVIDCNRPFDSPSSIPLISETTEISGNMGLLPAQVAQRRDEIFMPYHRRLGGTLDARERDKRPTFVIALHSFTPVYAGIARPWHIGTLYHNDARLPHLLRDALREDNSLVVGDNQPYAVSKATDYCIPVHCEPRKLVHTGIEIRQDLIARRGGQTEWAERLATIFNALEPELLKLARA
jgi:predicted N-formylglutamate amidohydrolase